MKNESLLRTAALGAIVTATLIAMSVPIRAQSAAAMKYADAQKQEHTVWAMTPAPSLAAIRDAAKTYESIVLRYPTNGVCDNALWQAANLMLAAYDRFGDQADQHEAARYLSWLIKEYPSSPFIKETAGKINEIRATSNPKTDNLKTETAKTNAVASANSPASVRSITRTALPRGDRITIEFSQETTYEGDRITSPDRVYFEFRNTTAGAPVIEHASELGGTLIKSMRIGHR